jgi:hypothetical protein
LVVHVGTRREDAVDDVTHGGSLESR